MGAGRLNGVRKPPAQALFQYQPVHHQVDGVLFILLASNFLGQIVGNAVHPDPGKTRFPGVLEDLLMLALLPPDHGRQYQKPCALPHGFHPVHDLVDGLTADFFPALGAVGNAHSGPEKPQVVIDLRHRTHSGAGVFGGGLLVDGNGGRQAVDGIHVGLIHLAQKLPCVGGQALHIPPLSLGVNGIKSKTGFPGAAEARKDHQFVPGNGQTHVFQVIFSGALNADGFVHSLLL